MIDRILLRGNAGFHFEPEETIVIFYTEILSGKVVKISV